MNVVVLGAGTVGTSIAELLCQQEDSVTVVDIDDKKTAAINEKLDVRALCGSASQSSVLFQAGISTADVCLAVTGSDETNIVGASLAKAMGYLNYTILIHAFIHSCSHSLVCHFPFYFSPHSPIKKFAKAELLHLMEWQHQLLLYSPCVI